MDGTAAAGRLERWAGQVMMNCPICDIELEKQHAHGLTIDVCLWCRSMWFDRGEIEVFKHQADKERLFKLDPSSEFQSEDDVAVRCPRCEMTTLEMGKIRGYEAGRCSACHGVWVHPGAEMRKRSKRDSSDSICTDIAALTALDLFNIFDI